MFDKRKYRKCLNPVYPNICYKCGEPLEYQNSKCKCNQLIVEEKYIIENQKLKKRSKYATQERLQQENDRKEH